MRFFVRCCWGKSKNYSRREGVITPSLNQPLCPGEQVSGSQNYYNIIVKIARERQRYTSSKVLRERSCLNLDAKTFNRSDSNPKKTNQCGAGV
jgi:hypothetical protein